MPRKAIIKLASKAFLKPFHLFAMVLSIFFATNVIASEKPAQAVVQSLEPIQITGRVDDAQVSPLGDTPLSQTPISATVIDAKRLRSAGATRLADLTNHEAGLSDAYNTVGYWDALTLRGFVLDSRTGFRREGLPISAETSIALFNKDRLEILKGASGFAAGTSVPAGMVNYRVKRPVASLRQADFRADSFGGASLAVDLSERQANWGLRVNAAAERLSGPQAGTRGNGEHFALAALWQPIAGTRIDAETEISRRSQPSVPGQSLWGHTLPHPSPRANPAEQSWMLPVVFAGQTSSLRLQQRLADSWQLQAQVQAQSLQTDDRTVFPFGCSDASGAYFANTFCPNGDADFYDYRSENERRTQRAVEAQLNGRFSVFGMSHKLRVSVLRSALSERYQPQAYNYIGTVNNIHAGTLPQDPAATDPTTLRDETRREIALAHAAEVNRVATLWWGTRQISLARNAVRTDGSRATAYSQSLSTPWLAFTHKLGAHSTAYLSRSSGVETDIAPNRSRYTNPSQAFSMPSWQTEAGYKLATPATQITAAWFHIRRSVTADFGACGAARTCTRAADGAAVHQGIELSAQHRVTLADGFGAGTWRIGGSVTQLQATREGSAQPGVNGKAPTNVPQTSLRLSASHTPKTEPRLSLDAQLIAESARQALPDNSVQIPGWQRLDAGLQWHASSAWSLSAGVENLTDAKAFRESPYQFGHSYLFNLAPRRFKLGLSFNG